MKLIIEIPEDSYRFILQHGIKDTHEIDEAIANGTPYNPTGDLISREAVKERGTKWFINERYYHPLDKPQNMSESIFLKLIDNTSTVE